MIDQIVDEFNEIVEMFEKDELSYRDKIELDDKAQQIIDKFISVAVGWERDCGSGKLNALILTSLRRDYIETLAANGIGFTYVIDERGINAKLFNRRNIAAIATLNVPYIQGFDGMLLKRCSLH